MYRHIALSLILALQLTNLRLVSTFITCRKSYNFEKDRSCYHVKYKDQNRFHYKTAYSRKCQLRCDEDPKCTKYFHNLKLNGCYLSQCQKNETCNDKFSIYPFTDYCPWIRYAKDLESEYKKCEPEMLSITIAAVVLTAVIVLALIYCQVNYSFRAKEKTAQIISSLRQSSSTATSEALDANNQTAVEVVVDAVTSPPPHSGSEHKDDPEIKLHSTSVRRFRKLSDKETEILEEVKGGLKCTVCSNHFNHTEHKPVLLIKCGHTLCKRCFVKSKNKICQQDNCGKTIYSDELDNFQIISVMEARNDVELIKALECMICFEVYKLEVNKPMVLNHCGHTICSSCIGHVFKCPQCRKNFYQMSSKENKTVRKLLELEYFIM